MAKADVTNISPGETIGNESITIDATAGGVGFTAGEIAVPSATGTVKAKKAEFKVETAPIRFTRNGTAPVAGTTGTLGDIGDVITIEGVEDISRFRAIRDTGVSGVIKPEYTR